VSLFFFFLIFTLTCSFQLTLSAPLRSLIVGLCEVGWHFRRITELVKTQRALPDAGLVSQSLCHAIDQELLEYHRLLVVLESQFGIVPFVATVLDSPIRMQRQTRQTKTS